MRKTLGFFSKCLAAAMPAMQDQLTAVAFRSPVPPDMSG
jgi:hypothetical protein